MGELARAVTLIEDANEMTASMGYACRRVPLADGRGMARLWQPMRCPAIEAAARTRPPRAKADVGVDEIHRGGSLQRSGRYMEALERHVISEYEDLGFCSWCLFELIAFRGTHRRPGVPLRWRCRSLRRGRAPAERMGVGRSGECERSARCQRRRGTLFVEAIERSSAPRPRCTRCVPGCTDAEWLRRVGRRRDAASSSATALEMFTEMGAEGSRNGRAGNDRQGEKVRKQHIASGDGLTAQEAQIARLAAEV